MVVGRQTMIDEQRTLEIFGYTSDQLTHGSDKPIVVVCEECGKYRVSTRLAYRDLCQSCCHTKPHHNLGKDFSGENAPAWKGGGAIVICKNCGVEFKLRAYGLEQIFCSNKCKSAYMVGENHQCHGKECSEETRQRISAGEQGIPFEEWTGFTDKTRPHIVPIHACIKMNERFTGSSAHHMTKSVVLYIPDELHRHIKHVLKTGENISIINTLAIQYLYGWW